MKIKFEQLIKTLNDLDITFSQLNEKEIIIPAVCIPSDTFDTPMPRQKATPFEQYGTDRPFTNIDRCVHMADYMASRNFIDIPQVSEEYDKVEMIEELEPYKNVVPTLREIEYSN